jgi:hypothetical protein
MSEKVKIASCLDTGNKTKDGKPIYNIKLSDGRQGAGFDSAFAGLPLNEDIEIDIAPAKDYNNEKRFYFNMPGQQKAKTGFAQKDWTLEKRRISLECSIDWCKSKTDVHTGDMLKTAAVFFNYLNEK